MSLQEHGGDPLKLPLTESCFHYTGALTIRSARDVLYVAFLFFMLGVHTVNHRNLYGSDPGWITFDTKLDDPQLPCQFCRMAPSLRSRHDHNTGTFTFNLKTRECLNSCIHHPWSLCLQPSVIWWTPFFRSVRSQV